MGFPAGAETSRRHRTVFKAPNNLEDALRRIRMLQELFEACHDP